MCIRDRPTSLYLELLKHLPGNRTSTEIAKERAVDMANLLKEDETSPFYRKIVTVTSPKNGEISMTQFVRKIHPMLKQPTGRLAIYNDEERCGIVDNYFKGLLQVFAKEAKHPNCIFFRTMGFGALMNVLPTFIDFTLGQSKGNFRVADVASVFKKIDYFDFENWHRSGSGSGVEAAAAEDLRTELSNSIEGSSNVGRISL